MGLKRNNNNPSCPHCNESHTQARGTQCGKQRFKCKSCGKMFKVAPPNPLGSMRLPPEKVVQCLKMLLEGMSVRSCERLTGVHRDTILKIVVELGPKCESFLKAHVQNHPFHDLQIDEQWGFVFCKQKTATRKCLPPLVGGDVYHFTAIDRDTKFIVGFHAGERDGYNARIFLNELRQRVAGSPQVSSDGFAPYTDSIPAAFDHRCHYGQVIKQYGSAAENTNEQRYSPAQIIRIERTEVFGEPKRDRICTSHAERHNLTNRMACRRLTRLTNGFSKKFRNHAAMLAIWFLFYNFCRPNMAFLKPGVFVPPTTPAMKAGLATHKWSVEELLTAVA